METGLRGMPSPNLLGVRVCVCTARKFRFLGNLARKGNLKGHHSLVGWRSGVGVGADCYWPCASLNRDEKGGRMDQVDVSFIENI